MFKCISAVLLYILLLAACNQPASTPVQPVQFSEPMATATPTALFNTTSLDPTFTPAVVTATPDFTCSQAPLPRVQPGQQVTVLVEDWDKLKLRSNAAIAEDNVVIELNQYTQLRILDGPVCVLSEEASFVFWKVAVIPSGEIGWVAEGDLTHYYIQ